MSKQATPPRSASLTEQLRWFLKNCPTTTHAVAKATGIHHSSLYRFLGETRGLSHDAMDRVAKHLNLRLVRDRK